MEEDTNDGTGPHGMGQYILYYMVAFFGIPFIVALTNIVFNMI